MIYATMCIGNKWLNKYRDTINVFSSKNHLEILTDTPSGLTGFSHYPIRKKYI